MNRRDDTDTELLARSLLAEEYEKGGTDGSYPTYAQLAREGNGAFTLCSIRAIERALRLSAQAEPGYVAGFEACREALADLISLCERKIYPQPDKPNSDWMRVQAAKAAIAAIPAPATVSAGWQPIETAPKEIDILVFNEALDYSFGSIQIGQIDHGGEWNFLSEMSLEDCDDDFLPTHWMPLPAAPTKRSAT